MVHMYYAKYNFHLAKSHRASTVAEDSKELEFSGIQQGKASPEVLPWIEQDGAETIPTLNRFNKAMAQHGTGRFQLRAV